VFLWGGLRVYSYGGIRENPYFGKLVREYLDGGMGKNWDKGTKK